MASNGFNGDGRGCGGHTCIVEFCGNDLVVILGFCPKIQDISILTIISHRRGVEVKLIRIRVQHTSCRVRGVIFRKQR